MLGGSQACLNARLMANGFQTPPAAGFPPTPTHTAVWVSPLPRAAPDPRRRGTLTAGPVSLS